VDNNKPLPTIAQLHARAHERLRNAWREDAVAPTPPAREDAPDATARFDVASPPKITDLYERHAQRSRDAWKNRGDNPKHPGPVGLVRR